MYFIYEILDKTHFGRLVNAIKWNFTGFNSDRTQQFSATWCYNMTFNNSFFSRTLSIFLLGANMMQISFKFYYSVLKASLLWECIIYTHIFEYLQRTGFFLQNVSPNVLQSGERILLLYNFTTRTKQDVLEWGEISITECGIQTNQEEEIFALKPANFTIQLTVGNRKIYFKGLFVICYH